MFNYSWIISPEWKAQARLHFPPPLVLSSPGDLKHLDAAKVISSDYVARFVLILIQQLCPHPSSSRHV